MSTLQALHSSGHCTRYFIIDEWMDANKGIDHLSLCQEKFKQKKLQLNKYLAHKKLISRKRK